MIIAIDGPAGSGKSSTTKIVAAKLGIMYLDTGAMYRAVTLKALRLNIHYSDDNALDGMMRDTVIAFKGIPPDVRIIMDGEDVSVAVRTDDVTKSVADYCASYNIRKSLVDQQRNFAVGRSLVCEGRDISTVVFPKAEIKIFMSASLKERAKRRQKDFAAMGISKSIEELMREMAIRDQCDLTRSNGPLIKVDDAIDMDTTGMTFNEQTEFIVEKVKSVMMGTALKFV